MFYVAKHGIYFRHPKVTTQSKHDFFLPLSPYVFLGFFSSCRHANQVNQVKRVQKMVMECMATTSAVIIRARRKALQRENQCYRCCVCSTRLRFDLDPMMITYLFDAMLAMNFNEICFYRYTFHHDAAFRLRYFLLFIFFSDNECRARVQNSVATFCVPENEEIKTVFVTFDRFSNF